MKTSNRSIKTKAVQELLNIKLSIVTKESEKLIDELEALCEKYSIKKDYFLLLDRFCS